MSIAGKTNQPNITQNSYIVQSKNDEFYCLVSNGNSYYQKYNNNGELIQKQVKQTSNLPPENAPKPNAPAEKQQNSDQLQATKTKGTIILNCDKSKFLIFVYDTILQIYDCSSADKEEKMICNATKELTNFRTIEDVKWSYYSPNVFACLSQKDITICQLDFSSNASSEGQQYKIKTRTIIAGDLSFNAFTWGDSCNIWLKYSIAYSTNQAGSIYLVRPATVDQFTMPFKDYLKMSSTLDANSSLYFKGYIETKGASRILKVDSTKLLTTEIPVKYITYKINALHWVNSYLNCYLIAIDESTTIYIISIPEVDSFLSDFSNSNYLSFLSPNNSKFNQANIVCTIDAFKNKSINFSYSNGFFFIDNTEKKLYRLFLKRRTINHDNINDFNNNENEIDENSIFNVADLDNFEENYKLTLLAEFDNIYGVYGNRLLLKSNANDYKFVQIGEFPDSIKKIDCSKLSKEQIKDYIGSFDHKTIKRRLDIQNKETQRLKMMNEVIRSEADLYEEKETEVKEVDEELSKAVERAEELQKRMHDIYSRLQTKLKK